MGGHLERPASEAVRARGGEATVQQIARGSAEVARHRLHRHKVSTNILVFQELLISFIKKNFRGHTMYISRHMCCIVISRVAM
jgi:hypothetical protein